MIAMEKHSVRMVSVVGGVGSGKATLVKCLVRKPDMKSERTTGTAACMNILSADEQDRGMNLQSSGVACTSFGCDVETVIMDEGDLAEKGEAEVNTGRNSFLINFIDSYGDVDFSSEVTAALRVTDGALVVVDCIQGVAVKTGTMLRQAMSERVRPCLMVNKVDRALLELQLSGEEIYQNMSRAIENVNVIVESYKFQDRDWQVVPLKGNVAFGSGLHQWGFTLKTFAKVYASKFNTTAEKMAEKLWGDWVFATNDGKNRWINSNSVFTNRGVDRDSGAKRAFVAFIMDPIIGMFQAVMNDELNENGVLKAFDMAQAVGVNLSEEIKKTLTGKALLKYIMQKWLPAAEAVLEMIVVHLPSPSTAQEYRCETLYDGPLDDEAATAIRTCDTSEGAPLMMYVSKMIPGADNRFTAFGRVFSGKIGTGQKVRILGPHYTPGKKTDLFEITVQGVTTVMGGSVTRVPAGSLCGVAGMGTFIPHFTITDCDGISGMRVPPTAALVRATVSAANPDESPQVLEAIRELCWHDPVIRCEISATGEHILAATDHAHLMLCTKALQLSAKVQLVTAPLAGSSDGTTPAPRAALHEAQMSPPSLKKTRTSFTETTVKSTPQRAEGADDGEATIVAYLRMLSRVPVPGPGSSRHIERDLLPTMHLTTGDPQSEEEFRRTCEDLGHHQHADALLAALRGAPVGKRLDPLLFSVFPMKPGKLSGVLNFMVENRGFEVRGLPERPECFAYAFYAETRFNIVLAHLFDKAQDIAQNKADYMFVALERERGIEANKGPLSDQSANWDIYTVHPFLFETSVGVGVRRGRVTELVA